MHRLRSYALKLFAVCLAAGVWQAAYGQGFPTSTVRVVVPFDPGTGPDILARTIGQRLSDRWGQPVVIENRPGAGTGIGAPVVAKSRPDGYTLMVTANTLVLNKSLRPNAPYDPISEFTPVAPLAIGQLALITHPSLGVRSIKELVAAAKVKPGAIDYASPAIGTPHHLAMELLKQALRIDMTHIPHTTTGAAVQSLVSGQTKVMFLPIHVALPHIQGKRVHVLSAGGVRRTAVIPDVPSLSEASGVTDVDVDIWFGMFAPAGTPAEIVRKINGDVNEVLKSPEVKDVLAKQGLATTGGKPEELGAITKADLARWTRVVREAKIKAE